jgi:hypothetical protein
VTDLQSVAFPLGYGAERCDSHRALRAAPQSAGHNILIPGKSSIAISTLATSTISAGRNGSPESRSDQRLRLEAPLARRPRFVSSIFFALRLALSLPRLAKSHVIIRTQVPQPDVCILGERESCGLSSLLNFADKTKEAEFNDCAGDRANSGQPA